MDENVYKKNLDILFDEFRKEIDTENNKDFLINELHENVEFLFDLFIKQLNENKNV